MWGISVEKLGVYCYLAASVIDNNVSVHSISTIDMVVSKVLIRCWSPNYVLTESLQRTIILLHIGSYCMLLDLLTIVHYEAGPCRNRHLDTSSTALSLTLGYFMVILVVDLTLVYRVRPF